MFDNAVTEHCIEVTSGCVTSGSFPHPLLKSMNVFVYVLDT